MNEGLFTAYQGLPEWERLLLHINEKSCLAVTEIAEGERPFLASALALRTGRQVMLISPSEKAAQRQKQDIERLFALKAAYLPPRDIQFSRAAMSRETMWQRLSVLSDLKDTKILCLSVTSALERCAPPALFRDKTIVLSEGLRVGQPEDLLRGLLSVGYERVPMVEGKGQCSGRGAIVDVFPSNRDNALRVEFFDDEVDSLRFFDPISQRSGGRLKTAVIAPATECLLTDPDAAAERMLEALRENDAKEEDSGEAEFLSELDRIEQEEDLLSEKTVEQNTANGTHLLDAERVRSGQTIRTAPMWIHILMEQTVPVTAYLDDPIILMDTPDQFRGRVLSAERELEDQYRDALRRGDAFPAQKDLRFTYEDALKDWTHFSRVLLTGVAGAFGGLDPAEAVVFDSADTPTFHSRTELLAQSLENWRKDGICSVLLTGGENRGKRLAFALEELKCPCVTSDSLNGNLIRKEIILLPMAYSKGFVHPAAGLCLLSDADLYGTAYQRARKHAKSSEKIASFTDLRPGDAVVHDLHGVGIFRGIVRRKNEGANRDYLQIDYAAGDKLFVPADQFDRVGKYIGQDGATPKLSRLGGGEWQRQKNKVKATLKELAFSLAELYAKRAKTPGYAFSSENPWQQEFNDRFPYELTEDQQKTVAEIEADMESPRNMDRLLCGDVGYGKTEVALRAAFKCVTEGKQAAILAPTTVLVYQHYNTIKKRFEGFPVRIEMLSRFRSAKEQRDIIRKLKTGDIDLIVGTHRLLAKDVQFKDLGLLVVDEEHRFGVNHKETIQHMKTTMDVLTLSATPIPRTLHMSMTGIRDMSLLETPPEERLPVKTYVTEYSDAVIRDAIRREMARGGQVYFLYNRVRSMEQMHARIQTLVPDARIAIAHGQMQEKALEDIMLDFYAGAYDVLLCTTIVESGLDVPDANTLIVFDADHYGLAQLYQLRGRVGRSSRQAYAYFTVRAGKELSETAEQRLAAIREFTEFGAGYRIAMRDLEIRGAGDVLGPQQSGHLSVVGYDTYVKLIGEAVSEAQGKPVVPELDTRVEMNVNAYLPQDYIAEEQVRIEVYKRIAMVEDEQTRMEIEDELIDRFGGVPEPVENLMRIAQLRGTTRKLGISSLTLTPDGLRMRFDPVYMPDLDCIPEALSRTDDRLRISIGAQPTVILAQKNMTGEAALETGIFVMNRFLEKLEQVKAEKASVNVPE